METNARTSKRALVVGLGIAGIASALRLNQIGWDVVVLEKAAERRRGGYFIGLFGTGIAAAERLGIGAAVPDRSSPSASTYIVDRKGGARVGPGYSSLPGKAHWMTRGDIEDAAFEALPDEVEIRYASTPVALHQDDHGVEVDILDKRTETVSAERFDLVVGADGLRSTIRKLAFEPQDELRRLGYMIAAFSLDEPAPGFKLDEAAIMPEDGRSAWIFAFADRPPTVLFSYRTDDVDREFKKTPIEALRQAYGPEPTGTLLGWLLDKFETAPDYLFDSAEQVHLDRWHRGRVVLVGDAAWCLTLYSGMGASTSLAGADLLGTMLQRRQGDLGKALQAWEAHLRPFIAHHTKCGVNQRKIFTAANRTERLVGSAFLRLTQLPVAKSLFGHIRKNGKDARMKGLDIAALGA